MHAPRALSDGVHNPAVVTSIPIALDQRATLFVIRCQRHGLEQLPVLVDPWEGLGVSRC